MFSHARFCIGRVCWLCVLSNTIIRFVLETPAAAMLPETGDALSPEAQMQLMKNMMAATRDPQSLGSALPHAPTALSSDRLHLVNPASGPSTALPSQASSLADESNQAEAMDVSLRDKRAAPEGTAQAAPSDRPAQAARHRETEEEEPPSGKGYGRPREEHGNLEVGSSGSEITTAAPSRDAEASPGEPGAPTRTTPGTTGPRISVARRSSTSAVPSPI